MEAAVRVHYGSSKPEWVRYRDGKPIGYWSEYHDGPLPEGTRTFPSTDAMDSAQEEENSNATD